MEKNNQIIQSFFSPFRLALLLSILLFIIETGVDVFLKSMNLQYPTLVAMMDALLLAIIFFPLIYLALWLFVSGTFKEKSKIEEETSPFKDVEQKNQKLQELVNHYEEEKNMIGGMFFLIADLKKASASIGEFLEKIISIASDPSTGMERTSASLQDFTVTLEELARSAKQIAKLAENIADISQKSHEIAQQGAQTLKFSQEALQNIQKSSNSITQRILDLNEKSREIGTILDIIETIVDKTDILALNAALEGTKAGEAGKGFSVVAKEMRRLSERVSESTTKIKEVIRDIQTAINSSVIATEEGVKTTVSGILVVEKTAKEFESIFSMVKSIKDASSQISLAIQQQTSATEQSVRSMNEISDVVRENTFGVKETSRQLSDLNGLVQKVKDQVENLYNLAPHES